MIWLQAAVLTLAASGSGEPVLLDFTADWCTYCRQMDPTLNQLAARGYPVRKVDVDRDRALAQRYGVRDLPCYVMVVDGREVDRVVGATSYGRLRQMFTKAAAARTRQAPAVAPAKPARKAPAVDIPAVASGPLCTKSATQPLVAPPLNPGVATPGLNAVGTATHNIATPGLSSDRAAPGWKLAAPGWSSRSAKATASDEQLISATVRLRIKDPDGHSWGTGTIIDARQGWALVLTCGHIFRDSHGKGLVEIDLFGPTPGKQIPGEVVSYDLDRDVGLVRFRAPSTVNVARVAPVGYTITNGDPVVNVGCNNGRQPTARHSRIRSQDKFLGPPNLQADGLPVVGRSGGGLFSREGFVIGVCNAADPADNEGLYAATASIRAELDRAGLAYVYKSTPASPTPEVLPDPRGGAMPAAALVRVDPPPMPERMPPAINVAQPPLAGKFNPPPAGKLAINVAQPPTAGKFNVPSEGQLLPTAARSGVEPARLDVPLSPEERAVLAEIRRHRAAGYEVVCIIRSRTDPRAKSKIVVLDEASPAFLDQLASEAR